MRFAQRLDHLPPFLFARLRDKVLELKARGVDVITLGAGDPDMPTPDVVIAAGQAALADPDNHHYPNNKGKPEFRAAASRFMEERFGVTLDPESEIFPILGGKEALHHLALCCLNLGELCLAPDPSYPVYHSAAALAGAEIHRLPLLSENGFLPDFGAVRPEVLDRARMLYLNYPNNPTGAVAGRAFFEDVVDLARRNDLIVVHDNAYSEIAFESPAPGSFLAAPGARDVGVEVFSLSKGWNMTGWRVGWVAGNAEIIARLAHLKPNIDAGMPGVMQDAAVAALTEARDFPARMSAVYRRRRDIMVRALRAGGLSVVPQKAGPFLWFPVPAGHSSTSFCDLLLETAGVVVSPGDAFGENGSGYARIALMVPDDRLELAAERILKALHDHVDSHAEPHLQRVVDAPLSGA